MAAPFGQEVFRRSGHVVAYGITVVAGYFAAGDVLSYFIDRAAPTRPSSGNSLGFLLRTVVQGGFVALFGLLAAVMVFVAIVGVGGALLSRAWSQLWLVIVERVSAQPGPRE